MQSRLAIAALSSSHSLLTAHHASIGPTRFATWGGWLFHTERVRCEAKLSVRLNLARLREPLCRSP